MPIVAIFHIYFSTFIERSRATFRGLAGHFWPADHRLGTPVLQRMCVIRVCVYSLKNQGICIYPGFFRVLCIIPRVCHVTINVN